MIDSFPQQQQQTNREYIVLGFVEYGSVSVGQRLLLGPTPSGAFIPIETRSIHVNKVSVNQANADQNATIGIRFDRGLNDEFIASGEMEVKSCLLTQSSASCNGLEEDTLKENVIMPGASITKDDKISPSLEENSSPYEYVRNLLGRKRGSGLVALPANISYEENTSSSTQGACFEFNAEIMILNHPSSVGVDYEPVVHALCVRQSAKIMSISLSGK